MKLTRKFMPVTAVAALAFAGISTTDNAQAAESSASMSFANMYLWRGQNISPNGAQIAGSIDYKHETGFYTGIWTSSEDAGSETDLYFGIGGEVSGFSWDVSYWWYMYPDTRDANTNLQVDLADNDAAEFALSGGYGPVKVTYYMNADSDNDDNNYLTISASVESFTFTYGMWDLENSGGDEYSHITATWAPIDNWSFTASKAMSDKDDDSGVEEDFLFQVMFTKSFDFAPKQ